jgi:23S rRNA (cytosine1962-C5)-methyltransferase
VARAQPLRWAEAVARYERAQGEPGKWISREPLPDRWEISHGGMRLELRATEFGHVGVFPEQAENWDWLARQVKRAGKPLTVLNLFAYTGAATLAVAAAGAAVTHVDSAQSTVNWARHDAALSGLSAAPIRWIAEDALKFARRELKRGQAYDAVILDPPSYGHGPRGESWKLSERLPELLALAARLTGGAPRFILLTCHTSGVGPRELTQFLVEAVGLEAAGEIAAGELFLKSSDGRRINCGAFARMSRED